MCVERRSVGGAGMGTIGLLGQVVTGEGWDWGDRCGRHDIELI